jgi:hypothetical protein
MAITRQSSARNTALKPRRSELKRLDVWPGFLLSHDEMGRINRLMGSALLDESLGERLIHQRDNALLASYGLSLETQNWLCSIEASTLDELAQAIVLCA